MSPVLMRYLFIFFGFYILKALANVFDKRDLEKVMECICAIVAAILLFNYVSVYQYLG